MKLRSILVGTLALAVGAAMGFAQPKAEKPAAATGAVSQDSPSPVSEPGVLVVAVLNDSPAQKAGIVRGDIILALNGTAVNTPSELMKGIEARKSGDTVSVRMRHGDAEKTTNVTLSERNGRTWMGTALYAAGRERERELGDDRDFGYQMPFSGAYVTSVVSGSPAEKAGLKEGDVILSVDGTNVDPRHGLADLIGAKKIGDTVTLSVETPAQGQGRREQAPRDVKVTLEKSPSSNVPYAGIQYTAAPSGFGRGPRDGAVIGTGVLIADVAPDGPAFKAGIKPGDVITKVQGAAVTEPKEVFDAVTAHKPGDTLSVTVRHAADEKDTDVSVTLGASPSDSTKGYMGVTIRAVMDLQGPGPRGFGKMPMQRAPGNAPGI